MAALEDNVGGGVGGVCLSSQQWDDDDGSSVERHRYFLARRTVLEMLRDRGYAIPSADLDLDLQGFRSAYGDRPDPEALRISAASFPQSSSSSSNPTTNKVVVIFCGPGPVKLSTAQGICAGVSKEEANLSRLILVLQSKMTAQARDHFKTRLVFRVETFHITELLVNITKHVLKPKHHILTEEEKQQLLNKFSVKENQLPRMLETDAVARYYGLGHGQIMKITYDGELTGSHVTYRCIM